MKNKIFSVLVGLLAVFLGACSDDDDVLTTSSVHVNGGPLEESITPTSARVRIRLNETAGIGEVGICYGVPNWNRLRLILMSLMPNMKMLLLRMYIRWYVVLPLKVPICI